MLNVENLKSLGIGAGFLVACLALAAFGSWLIDVTPGYIMRDMGIGLSVLVSIGCLLWLAWAIGRSLRYGPCRCWHGQGEHSSRVYCPVHKTTT